MMTAWEAEHSAHLFFGFDAAKAICALFTAAYSIKDDSFNVERLSGFRAQIIIPGSVARIAIQV